MTRFPPNNATARFWLCCGGALLLTLCLDGTIGHALAQTPFGAPRPATTSQAGGLVGWILDKQSEFYRQMSTTIRAAKSDGSAVWTLIAISFAYGIFHAAGPGHGKAVISSYRRCQRGDRAARHPAVVRLGVMQAVVAVAIVGIGAWMLNATAKTMCSAERVIEIASYALIAAFGARLVWSKGGNFMRALQTAPASPAAALVPAGAAHRSGPFTSSRSCPRSRDVFARPRPPPRARRALRSCPRSGTGATGGPGRLAARFRRGDGGGAAPLFRGDPGSGVRTGTGAVLGRRRRDLRDGAWNRHHGGGHRHAGGLRQGIGPTAVRRAAGRAEFWSCVASNLPQPAWSCCSESGLLLGYVAAERVTCL